MQGSGWKNLEMRTSPPPLFSDREHCPGESTLAALQGSDGPLLLLTKVLLGREQGGNIQKQPHDFEMQRQAEL